ncbi:MAG: ABC transporter permease [Chthoniobacterales bacterium]
MIKSTLALTADIFYWTVVAPLRGKPFRLSAVFQQMVRIGVQAMPMTALTSLSIGLTLAMQAAHELARMGATAYVPDLVGISLLRELGPLLVGVVIIGRSGSAVTAELGTMKVSEEIEALEVMAINPIRFLVVPRFLAMMIMLPVLTVFGNYVGIVGGWSICHFALGMPTDSFILRILESSHPMDLWSGMIKSVVFAWLIITIACESGLAVTGGAEGVGQATTGSVVKSILAMLIANAALTAIFFVAEN